MSGFRVATTDDEEFFYSWRQRAERLGRAQGWWHGTATEQDTHHRWYLEHLRTSTLLVWQWDNGAQAGIARIESNGEVQFEAYKPDEQPLLEDLKPFADHYGRFKMTLDEGDPKWEALEAAGFRQYPARFYVYRERP